MNGKAYRQSIFQANASMVENKVRTGSEFSFLANWNLAYHYRFLRNTQWELLAGPNLDLNGGMIYNFRNSSSASYCNAGYSDKGLTYVSRNAARGATAHTLRRIQILSYHINILNDLRALAYE